MRRLAIIILLLTVSGCSGGMDGVYSDQLGTTSYDFRDSKRVYVTVLDVTVAAQYRADGDEIIVHTPQGTLVLARHEDHLIGPQGQLLLKQPS